jgi:hypothetical protein
VDTDETSSSRTFATGVSMIDDQQRGAAEKLLTMPAGKPYGWLAEERDQVQGEHWIRWQYLDGRRLDDPRAVAQRIDRGLRHLEGFAVIGQPGMGKDGSGDDETLRI